MLARKREPHKADREAYMSLDVWHADRFSARAESARADEREIVEALLIDPDPADLELLSLAAARSRQLRIHVTLARSLAEAERLMADAMFDIVYLEYWFGEETALPFIQGFAALHGSPCVVLTDLDESDIRRLSFRAGAQAFLSKEALGPQALESVTLAVLGPKLTPPRRS